MKIAIINYGMGNLASVHKAFQDIGSNPYIADHPDDLQESDRIVLPGVGAFSEGMQRLIEHNWVDAFHKAVSQGKPILGICLGMQMLASVGEEGGDNAGLGIIPGKVRRLDTIGCSFRIPHVGWNEVNYTEENSLFNEIPDHSDFYFVHSFAYQLENKKHLVATVSYDVDFPVVIKKENVIGCQFHPEKSSKAGRKLLKNFLELS